MSTASAARAAIATPPSTELLDRLGRPYPAMTLRIMQGGHEPQNKGEHYPPEVYRREDLLRVMKRLGRGACGDRDRAIMMIMWRAGGRISETLKIRPRDINPAAGTVHFKYGKGSKAQRYKPRTVAIDDEAMAVITKWLDTRQRILATTDIPSASAPLFIIVKGASRGLACHHSTVREKFQHAARRAGLTQRMHPHGLRHTYAVELLREGYDLKQIQHLMGHSNVAITDRYLHVDVADLHAQVRQRRWSVVVPDAAPVDPLTRLAELEGVVQRLLATMD